MAEHNLLYQRAVYYDIALRRDVTPEIDFLLAVYEQRLGRPARSALEIACGPAYHARALARRGLNAFGLDLQPHMIAFAQELAAADAVSVDLLVADMRRFELPAPVDITFALFDALDALVANADLVQHWQCVAHNLTAGGLYIIDLTHPRDVSLTTYADFSYQGQRDGIAVEIAWATTPSRIDLVAGVAYTEVELRVTEQGEKKVMKDTAAERLFVPQELQLLADLSGELDVVSWYGDFNLNQPLDMSAQSRRMIVVCQKKTGGDPNE